MAAKKFTKEEMTDIAYMIQDEIITELKKRPWKITTNREFTIIRIVWDLGYEKREWYNQSKVDEIIKKYIEKYGIHIHEITKDRDKPTSIWLTKKNARPVQR